MRRDGLQALALSIASIAMILASTLAMDWFVARIGGAIDVSKITFDLREARACADAGPCAVVPVEMIKRNFYPTFAAITFWGSLAFVVIIIYQGGSKLLGGFANETLAKASYVFGSLLILSSVGAGYLFGPDLGPASMMGLDIDVGRGWGPSTMLLGLLLGMGAIYAMREASSNDVEYKPIDPIPAAIARHKPPTAPPPVAQRAPTAPPVAHTTTSLPRPKKVSSAPMQAMPDQFKGKIQFAVVSGEITVAGIDARREDGHVVLVMWRDVVGLVVRRLPPELDGHPFVDIVSTAGMTLRMLPWSRLTGEPVDGDAEARARAFVQLVRPRCPDAKLDKATLGFLDDTSRKPAQLSSLDLLAKHDQAIA
jgi:hypothetical protein